MKTAFIFPGQGAQFIGMGKDIVEVLPQADDIFERANKIVGYDLKSICFKGPAERLNSTTVSQPAIFTVSAAILDCIRTNPPAMNLQPDVTAGLSLGEYTALYAAGIMSFEDGLKLVQRRGQAMQAAAELSEGSMVSIIGLNEQQVRELCKEAAEGELLLGVNFNCPGQIVISGTKSACKRAEKLAEKYGAIKAISLAVAGAFHTEMMKSAADSLAHALAETKLNNPANIQIIANTNAEYYKSASEISEGLQKQLIAPILWQRCMEILLADGVEQFYEIGPGKVLTGLMKRINRKIKVINVSDLSSLKNLTGE